MAKCKSCGRWERDQSERAMQEHLGKDEWQVSITANPNIDIIPPISVIINLSKKLSLEERQRQVNELFDFIDARAKDFENTI